MIAIHLELRLKTARELLWGRLSLIESDLKSGKIVKPFDIDIQSSFSYYLVCPHEKLDNPRGTAFRDFILGEVL